MKQIELLISRYPSLECVKNDIYEAYKVLEETFQKNGKLLIAGNGGSAADAEHIVGELMKGFKNPRKVNTEFANRLINENEQFAFLSSFHLG